MIFIIGGDGKEYGPVSAEQVREWIKAGRASLETTQARRDGETQLRPLREFLEFHAEAAPLVYAAPQTALGNQLASRLTRLGSSILDSLIAAAFLLPGVGFMIFAGAIGSRHEAGADLTTAALASICTGALGLTAFIIIQCWMIATRGQSMAKRLVGIRIVKTSDHTTPDFAHSVLLRTVVPRIIGFVPGLGPLFFLVDACFIFTDQKRCLHDLMADTIVIQGQPPSL